MLADFGIVLFDLHLLRHGAFVFGGGVEVTGSGTRYQSDLVAHESLLKPELNFLAVGTHIFEHFLDAELVDNAHTFS